MDVSDTIRKLQSLEIKSNNLINGTRKLIQDMKNETPTIFSTYPKIRNNKYTPNEKKLMEIRGLKWNYYEVINSVEYISPKLERQRILSTMIEYETRLFYENYRGQYSCGLCYTERQIWGCMLCNPNKQIPPQSYFVNKYINLFGWYVILYEDNKYLEKEFVIITRFHYGSPFNINLIGYKNGFELDVYEHVKFPIKAVYRKIYTLKVSFPHHLFDKSKSIKYQTEFPYDDNEYINSRLENIYLPSPSGSPPAARSIL